MPRRLRIRRTPSGLGTLITSAGTGWGDTAPAGSREDPATAAARASREFAGKVLAATLRSVRDLDIAEESTADAFLHALQTWPRDGVPASVDAWLITTARNRALDRVRRAQAAQRALLREARGKRSAFPSAENPADVVDTAVVGDDELRMVVLCCDPRLSTDEQVALTLRLACGVPTASIAAGFGIPTPTMAARLTRAKAKLVRLGPQLDLPDDATVDARLPAVATVVYLAGTLGHTAGSGERLADDELADRARYLARVLHRLRPAEAEFTGLLALILLTRARAGGRLDETGGQILLGDADRSRWDAAMIAEGLQFAAMAGRGGPLALQAAIAAEHARAASLDTTDWPAVLALYSQLLTLQPAHTVAVGRSIAVGRVAGPAAGLRDLDEVIELGGLDRYPYAFGARGYFLEQLGRLPEAAAEWRRAATLARTAAERDYFDRRAENAT